MATITTDSFWDTLTGTRTAGEANNINGASLTIRTDTRWYGGPSGAPAGMTGSIGTQTISPTLGGQLIFDATNVRWLAYDTGGGVVPAINTSITQGGVTGTLLGVWASLTSAPTAVGGAMPSTGFIKFREVTGGNFAAGALTGITANATGADVLGWIEIVMDEAATVSVPRLGTHRARGGRYFLANTSGAAQQVIQTPTNNGGANSFLPGIWIETGVATDVYEFYPAITVASGFTTANLGTDVRAKFVQNLGSGQVRIGGDGTNAIGFVPPSGCRTWIPNIILRNTTAANRALNVIPNATLATRPDWTTTAAGSIDLEYCIGDWYPSFASAFSVRVRDTAVHDAVLINNIAAPLDIDGLNVGIHTNAANTALILQNCFEGGTVSNGYFPRTTAAASGLAISLIACAGQTFNNIKGAVITLARNATGYALNLNQCTDLTFNNCQTANQQTQCVTTFDTTFNNHTILDRLVGVSNATTGLTAINCITSCNNITVNGLSFGPIANVAPATACFGATQSNNLTFQNVGTRGTVADTGSTAARVFLDGGANNGVTLKRIYLEASTTSLMSQVNTSKNFLVENCQATFAQLQTLNAVTTRMKGCGMTNAVTGQSSVYSADWADMFTSATAGRVALQFNEPVGDKLPFFSVTSGSAEFTSAGTMILNTSGDQVVWSMDYFALGHTALANVAPTFTGFTGANHTVEYRLDTGTGFSGAWKTLNATNLSGETISPSSGFRLQYRITATATNTDVLTTIRIDTVSTLVAQQNNLYPLTNIPRTYSLTGLSTSTEVVVFSSSNVEIAREVISGTSFTYNYSYQGSDSTGNYILLWKNDKTPIKLTGVTFGNADQSIPISQVDDLVYTSPYVLGASVDFVNKLHIMSGSTNQVSVPVLYSQWKDEIRLTNNAQYDFAYSQLGNNPVGGNFVPAYVFQINGWKLRPREANHTLAVTGGILVGNGDPFVNTLGSFIVRINYEQPVQAIGVAGAGGATAADVTQAKDEILAEVVKRLKTTTYLALK